MLELTGEHFSWAEHIYWQHMGILPSLHFSGQRLMNWLWCISVTFKMLRLKSQFENLPKKHIIPLLAHFNALLNKQNKTMTMPNLRCMIIHYQLLLLLSITRNIDLADILHSEGSVPQNNFEN